MDVRTWISQLNGGERGGALRLLYGGDAARQQARYLDLLSSCAEMRGDVLLISAPGRTELIGNHTDHQRGRVLAAAVALDVIAAAEAAEGDAVRLASPGFWEGETFLSDLTPHMGERGTTPALIRGVAAYLKMNGWRIGAFDARCDSSIPAGAGLSSSAAFETLIGSIFSHLYNGGTIPAQTLALAGQYAENQYFGKPCGLMDQMASSLGGAVRIDFSRPGAPGLRRLHCPFAENGYQLVIINAGGSHAELTGEYAAIPAEMRSVARAMGAETLGETSEEAFYAALGGLRGRCQDRALLRAMHFYEEDRRVELAADALEAGDMDVYVHLMRASGDSSFTQLQNIYPAGDVSERSVALALALCRRTIGDRGGWRVHGGGFAGTVQALAPAEAAEELIRTVRPVFGEESCCLATVRPVGGCSLETL